ARSNQALALLGLSSISVLRADSRFRALGLAILFSIGLGLFAPSVNHENRRRSREGMSYGC
ncbi:MAG TPA: hypothetical protein VEJ39_07870, partial [Candidatus Acidoferrales bacterium]|nr:hypothetical protein [Candidatus Acidoferrales bacterium]